MKLNNEIWRDIFNYEGCYQVSNFGRVKSLERFTNDGHHILEKILSQSFTKGYLKVGLSKNGKCKTIYVHKLVADAFIPNPNNLPEINHKDENKENNMVDNLERCTYYYNIHYGSAIERGRNKQLNSKKTSKSVVKIGKNNEIIDKYESINEASRQTNINCVNICQCCNKKRKTAGGYKWAFVKEVVCNDL